MPLPPLRFAPYRSRRPLRFAPSLLQARADRRDAVGVEAEPVHAPDVPRVLDLQAAVHDHGQARVLGDPGALLVDDAELAPHRRRARRDRLAGDAGQGGRGAEYVDDVDRHRHVGQARVRRLAEDLRLARVDRDDPVTVALEVVADEVARPQLVGGQPDDRDRRRRVQDALDRGRVLVRLEVHQAALLTLVKPCSRSQIRSSALSVPTDSRTVPARTPEAASSASLSWRWVVLAGWMIRLFASPTLARCDQRVTPRIRSCPPSRPPSQSKENTAPAPRGR